MSELEDKIAGIFNNPEEMQKITAMAKSLMDGGLFGTATEEKPEPKSDGGFDPMLQKIIGGFMGQSSEKNSTDKLSAICTYLDDSHSRKLERGIKMAKMAKIARMVMRDYGGDSSGDE